MIFTTSSGIIGIMRFALIVAAFCAFHSANFACNKSVPGNAVGAWGGEHVALQVSNSGARLELDCAHGEISGPLTVDKHGNFDMPGTFTPEHGGPIRKDENSNAQPARYTGHIEGDTMTLKIVRGQQESGPLTLTRNAQPKLTKCL